METGQLSYLCVLPIFPRDLSVAAAPREALRCRECQCQGVPKMVFFWRCMHRCHGSPGDRMSIICI